MDREIETDIASTRADMGAQLSRLRAMDDPVESIHAALTFENACREVILDLADMCREKLDDIANWALGPAGAPRGQASASSTIADEIGQSVPTSRPAPRKRPAARTAKARASKRPVKARRRG